MSLLLAAALLSPAPVATVHEERILQNGSDLAAWCREEAEAQAVGEGLTPYQWRASHYQKGRALYVRASLRIDGEDVPIACRVPQGARERYAVIEFPAGG